jgi:DNA modification methylase
MFNIYNIFSKKFIFKQDLVWKKNRGFSLCDTVFTPYHENILYFVKPVNLQEFINYLNKKRLEKGLSLSDINQHFGWATTGGGCASSYMGDKKDNYFPSPNHYNLLKEFLGLDNRFDELIYNRSRPTFNFEDIKREGTSYKIKKEGQKLYGQKSGLGKYQSRNNGRNPPTVLEFNIVQSGKEYFGHPTTKPSDLSEYLIKASSNVGDTILIPFVGTGSEIVKSKELNRNFIGFEISKEYCDIAEKRLRKTQPLPPEVLKAKPTKLEAFT